MLVDSSAGMRRSCRERIPEAAVVGEAPTPSGAVGCAVAVEWFDALPVHRIRRRGDRLLEVYVDLDSSGDLAEREGPPGNEVRRWAERFGAAPEEGDEAEVALALGPALDTMAGVLGRGFVMVVDYGHPAAELFSPRHRRGTLLAYSRHQAHEGLLARPGEQDLTAHVNFTALESRAGEVGLRPLGLTTQDRFLIANGILDAFADPDAASWNDPSRVKRRLQAKQLIHPGAMGRAFRVWIAAKALPDAPALRGLADPFAGPVPGGGRE